MADLVAIVRATRASAKATEKLAEWERKAKDAKTEREQQSAVRQCYLWGDRLRHAQATLAANPLPGDVP